MLGAGEILGQDVTAQIEAGVVPGQDRARSPLQEVADLVRAVYRSSLRAVPDRHQEGVDQEASPGLVQMRPCVGVLL